MSTKPPRGRPWQEKGFQFDEDLMAGVFYIYNARGIATEKGILLDYGDRGEKILNLLRKKKFILVGKDGKLKLTSLGRKYHNFIITDET